MHMRDASGVLKSVSAMHFRDAGNTLRSVSIAHMRNTSNALKQVFGASTGSEGVSISPAGKTTSSTTSRSNTSSFTASFTGGTPSSITWSIVSPTNASASVTSGQGTATASVKLTVSGTADPATGSCKVKCTAVINGVTVTATVTKTHTYDSGSGGTGGGGGGGGGVSISPPNVSTSSATSKSDLSSFTATFSGGTPSSINWTVDSVSGGTATFGTGQGTATINVTVNCGPNSDLVTATIRCTAVIGGVSYSATCNDTHSYNSTN